VVEVTWHDRLSEDDLDAVRELLRAVGVDELRGGIHAIARDPGLVGYLHVNTRGDARGRPVAELFVHPDHRRRGVGAAMTESLIGHVSERPLRIWSHGDHPGAARLAEKFGFARVRELLKLGLSLRDCPQLPVPSWPPGVRLRTFVPGQDEPDVIAVNARAFDWHPEQGALTVDDLAATEDESWFDPDGFFLAMDPEDRLLGFHWTKVHNENPPVGEVYVVGVDPDAQGNGLGKALTLAGLHHLHRQGLSEVILYVEADNHAAFAVYQHLGFDTTEIHAQYELAN
jgi:mycothiol synthase